MYLIPRLAYTAISIHALAKRATSYGGCDRSRQSYFNPRPRKEGDCKKILRHYYMHISIHALAKRATPLANKNVNYRVISIHALAKRATLGIFHRSPFCVISIHALAKRAT